MRALAHKAMIESNADYVQMLLDNGLKFSDIIAKDGLYELYNQVNLQHYAHQITLTAVGGLHGKYEV